MGYIATILLVVIALQIFMLVSDIRPFEVVRAGKVNKNTARYRLGRRKRCDNTAGLKPYAVSGESMRDYDIHDGDTVYVQTFNDGEKNGIETYPVLMFSIDGMGCLKSRWKLRKFVTYIDDPQHCDWEKVYEYHEERFRGKITKAAFCDMCREKAAKLAAAQDHPAATDAPAKYVLSETREEKYLYSLHPADSIHGKVCYAA